MIGRKAPKELGRLVDAYRPLRPVYGWAIIAALTLPLPAMAAVGQPGPIVALAIAVPFFLCWTYGFGELLFLEHRIYEHGVLFGAALPGLKNYVVPHYTIDPNSVHVGGRRLHNGTLVEAVDRRFRQCPFVGPTVRFDGLDPHFAHQLARKKLTWAKAGREPLGIRGTNMTMPRKQNRWMVTYRDGERHAELLRATVISSQQTDPYYRTPTTSPLDER